MLRKVVLSLLQRTASTPCATQISASACTVSSAPFSNSDVTCGAWSMVPWRQQMGASCAASTSASGVRYPCSPASPTLPQVLGMSSSSGCLLPQTGSWQSQQMRSIFGAPVKKINKQIHTHDKYKEVHPQPTYDWMVGRFIMDRDGVIWHKQANSSHHQYNKTSGQLTRLKRLKPVARGFARKLRKVGFKRRFWLDPDARMVPGFHTHSTLQPLPRHDATPDKRRWVGDPALRAT